MRKHVVMIVLGVVVALGLLSMTVLFQVDQSRDIVLVMRFGRIVRVLDKPQDAGLHFKWPPPIERVVRYDARASTVEDALAEIRTKDRMQVMVSNFCTWRIDDPEKFFGAVGTVEECNSRIRQILADRKKAVFSAHDMAELINTDPGKLQLKTIENELLIAVRGATEKAYGVTIDRVGVVRWGLSDSTAVIEAMKQQQEAEAQRYTSEGKALKDAIVARARADAEQIKSFARLKAAKIRTEAARTVAEHYKQYGRDKDEIEFATFLRNLDTLRTGFTEGVFIFDGSKIPGVRLLREGANASLLLPPAENGGGQDAAKASDGSDEHSSRD